MREPDLHPAAVVPDAAALHIQCGVCRLGHGGERDDRRRARAQPHRRRAVQVENLVKHLLGHWILHLSYGDVKKSAQIRGTETSKACHGVGDWGFFFGGNFLDFWGKDPKIEGSVYHLSES